MKRTMIFAAVAAMFMFASCQKEEVKPVQDSTSDELVFTATIDPSATKTTVNTDGSSADKGKVSWESDDVITISDGTNSAVYEIEAINAGVATFKKKSGDNLQTSGVTYTASYGGGLTTAQTYSSSVVDLPMIATSTTTTFSFQVVCGLLKLNLTASGDNAKDISKIEIVGTPTGGSAAVYTLTCDNESIASAKDFYIALPAGSYNLMKYINSKGSVCFKKATTAMAIEANKIQPVTLSGITFSAILPGKFSVSASKQVQFTTANLWCNTSSPVTYSFEPAQTDYPTAWNTEHVGHFYWTKTAAASYAESYNDGTCTTSDKFFVDGSDADHKLSVDGQSDLYALSSAEWTYLLSAGGRGDGDSKFKKGITVNGVANCLVIAPDGYTGTIADSYDAAAWATAESSGLVCLPAAGSRSGSDLGNGGSVGIYWSATPSGIGADKAYLLGFHSSGVSSGSEKRSSGYSLRLVKGTVSYPEAPALACVKIGEVTWAPVNCGYDATHTYGLLYQWGRKYGQAYELGDLTPVTLTKEQGENPENSGEFGLCNYDEVKEEGDYNWFSGGVDNTLWAENPKGTYDPCPTGWRVPTYAELNALIGNQGSSGIGTAGWDSVNKGYWFNGTTSPSSGNGLFLPVAGFRHGSNGNTSYRGEFGYYWASSVDDDNASYLDFSSGPHMSSDSRAYGYSVRCVQE